MGLPGAVFLAGISESWLAIGLIIGTFFNWKLVAARLRVYTEIEHNSLTLPDFFTHRFKDTSRILRIAAAAVILIFFTIYCASGMVAVPAFLKTHSASTTRRPFGSVRQRPSSTSLSAVFWR